MPGTEIISKKKMLVLSDRRVQWVAKGSNHWAVPGRIRATSCIALNRIGLGTRMEWDNERYPRTKKVYFDSSFIDFGISHSRLSDFGISFLDMGYPIPGFLNLRYPRDIPKKSLGYPAHAHIPGLSQRYPIDIPKQADLS
jgi:hypothetical protein